MRMEEGLRPPKGVFELAERLAREATGYEHELRACQRYKLTAEVSIQPVDESFKPTGEPFVAVTQDISAHGLGFVHTRAVNDRLLCIALRGNLCESLRGKALVMEIVRCDPVGSLYSIAGKFVAKIDDPGGWTRNDEKRLSGRDQKRLRRPVGADLAPLLDLSLTTDPEPDAELSPVAEFIPRRTLQTRPQSRHAAWLLGGLFLLATSAYGMLHALASTAEEKSVTATAVRRQAAKPKEATDRVPIQELAERIEASQAQVKQPQEDQQDIGIPAQNLLVAERKRRPRRQPRLEKTPGRRSLNSSTSSLGARSRADEEEREKDTNHGMTYTVSRIDDRAVVTIHNTPTGDQSVPVHMDREEGEVRVTVAKVLGFGGSQVVIRWSSKRVTKVIYKGSEVAVGGQ